MNNDEIHEEELLLPGGGHSDPLQAKKTYSLNTGLLSPAGNIGYSGDLDE